MSDIEGAEHLMVQRDPAALESCDQIIMEVHGLPARYEPTLRALNDDLGFRQVAQGRYVFVFERGQG